MEIRQITSARMKSKVQKQADKHMKEIIVIIGTVVLGVLILSFMIGGGNSIRQAGGREVKELNSYYEENFQGRHMKEMITAIGGCLLILVMIIEIVVAENTFSKMTSIGQEVANFKEVVRQDGCVTSANAKNIKERIGKILFFVRLY